MCVLDAVFRRTLRATALCSNTLYTAIPETVSELGHLRVELVMFVLRAFLSPFFRALLEEFPYDLECVVTKSGNQQLGCSGYRKLFGNLMLFRVSIGQRVHTGMLHRISGLFG